MNRKEISREVFEELYFKQGLPIKVVASRLGISEPTTRKRFRSHNLMPRPRGTWAVKYTKTRFNGEEIEKAYMLGFRAGDLNVYAPAGKSNIIVARTNTTSKDQIQVMQTLFSKYGGVKVSGKGDVKCVNCFLDTSFSFLLLKPYYPELWVIGNAQNCLAFMAGYIDAEGNFIINQGRARFKLDCYDADILHWMHEWLLAKGVRSTLRLIAKKGDANYDGGHWNGNLWRINVNEAHSLLTFCQWLKPHMIHRNRIAQVDKCLENVIKRKKNGTV